MPFEDVSPSRSNGRLFMPESEKSLPCEGGISDLVVVDTTEIEGERASMSNLKIVRLDEPVDKECKISELVENDELSELTMSQKVVQNGQVTH